MLVFWSVDVYSAWREKERRREEEEQERKKQRERERIKKLEQEREEQEKTQLSKWDKRAAAKAEAIVAGSMWLVCVSVVWFSI